MLSWKSHSCFTLDEISFIQKYVLINIIYELSSSLLALVESRINTYLVPLTESVLITVRMPQ